MDCLKDYILLDGVTPKVTPNSNLYLNRELTIPMLHISGMVSNDQGTLEGIWDEVQTKAIKKFLIRLKLGMQELFSNCMAVDEAWVCKNRETLAMPLLYFLGTELMLEVTHTNRINRYTSIDKNRALEMRDEFTREFQVQLKAALEMINANPKTELGQVFTYVEVLP